MGKIKYKSTSKNSLNLTNGMGIDTESKISIRGNSTEEIHKINTDKIIAFEKQARSRFDETELGSLIDSIRAVGIFNPLLVTKDDKFGYFKVINGERRLRAARIIQLDTVPCRILKDDSQSELIAIIDNIQRSDLHPIELANAFSSLINRYGDKKIISNQIGISYTSFLETLKLNGLPESIKQHLLDNNLRSRAVFRKLLKAKSINKMQECLGLINNEKLNNKEKLVEIFFVDKKFEAKIFHKNILNVNKELLCTKLKELCEQMKGNI